MNPVKTALSRECLNCWGYIGKDIGFSQNMYVRVCWISGGGMIMNLTQGDIYMHKESTSFFPNSVILLPESPGLR